MPAAPNPTQIFHITAIDNLASIARSRVLHSTTRLQQLGIVASNIAYGQIQARRALKRVLIAPGGTLHDYVPFYFAPRSPMLMTINEGNVAGCAHRQGDIVHLVSSAQAIAGLGRPFVFTDVHAVLDYSSFHGDLARLDQIDWPLFFETPRLDGYCQFWHSKINPVKYARRRETRQAEFLVHEHVPIAAITEIGVHTQAASVRVTAALAGTGWCPPIRVVPGWYYD